MHLVMFDIDGTLTHSDAVDADCFAESIEQVLNLPPIDRDWSKYRHVTDSGIAAEIIESHFRRPPNQDEIDRVQRRFIEVLETRCIANPVLCRPVEGAAEMLSRLSGRGDVAIALATGGWKASAQLKCRMAGLPITDYALASADDSHSREEIMSIASARAAELFGISEFDRVVYVGDGLWDWQASRALRIPFIGIADGEAGELLTAAGATMILPHFGDCSRFVTMLGLNSERQTQLIASPAHRF
jgi:phosphoglycolate phosphatase-like HAD superfamily hydrolase